MQPKTWSPNLFEENGFAMTQENSFRDIQVTSSEIGVRTIALNDLWQSLKEGYDDFNATPAVGMFLTVLLFLLFALLLTLVLVGKNLLPSSLSNRRGVHSYRPRGLGRSF